MTCIVTDSAMATTKFVQHPCHEHPLVKQDLSIKGIATRCDLCHWLILGVAYTCQEGCKSYYFHEACVEAPPQIDLHPLRPVCPLTLIHDDSPFKCDTCGECFRSGGSSFRCDECDLNLDMHCALSTLSEEEGSQGCKTSEQIILPLHQHTLASFSTRHDFKVRGSNCYICQGSVEEDGYMCLHRRCEFVIHKRCIQDLYYADGTKAPRVYHRHPLEVFVGEDTGSNTCASCGSDKSGEFIGCASCQEFYHRHCFQVPEILRYPSHDPDHTLVLFPGIETEGRCQSCSVSLEDEIYYSCTSCEFFVHIGCAFQVLAYFEEGLCAIIELSWHKHPLPLCHRAQSFFDSCSCCKDELDGPAYVCKEEYCELMLHKQCTELAPKIDQHPHHPEHPLALITEALEGIEQCAACSLTVVWVCYSCKLCEFYLHVECVSRLPTRKHYLHEHDLVQFDKISSVECNRCCTADNSPIFRCVPCNFNLHKKCMELPPVVKHKTHCHPLTLREFFREDDSGEYYCDLCEKRRDGRLGVYVCGDCERKMDRPWAFHIECVLPELRKVYVKEDNTIAMERLADEITRREEEVRATKRKLDEMERELEELRKKHASMALE